MILENQRANMRKAIGRSSKVAGKGKNGGAGAPVGRTAAKRAAVTTRLDTTPPPMAAAQSDSSSSAGLRPIQRDTQKDRIYVELKRALMGGHFRPGEQITVKSVAERLEAGVMPVRDAIHRLIAEGGLQGLASGRVRVPLMRAEEFDDLIELRLALEPLAAARTTRRITPDVVVRLRAALDTLRVLSVAEPERLLWENFHFHFAIYRPCGSLHMVDLIESLWLRFGPLLVAAFKATPRASVDRYIHAEEDLQAQLVEAMAAGDDTTAALLLRQIIRTSATWYHEVYPFPSDTRDP